MRILFKTMLICVAIFCSHINLAQAKYCEKNSSMYPCGIEFTSIPSTPELHAGSPAMATYTIENQGSSSTSYTLALTEIDSLGDSGALNIDGASTCQSPGTLNVNESCDIVIFFYPQVEGNLDWDLTVTPQAPSTQRPLVLSITGTVLRPSYSYMVNNGSNSISICGPDPLLGFSCQATTMTDPTFNGPKAIALNPSNTFAYISNFGSNDGTTVSICPINPDATFGTCTSSTGSNTFNQPNSLAFNADASILYVANGGIGGGPTGNTVSACPINLDGSLGTCVSSASAGSGANGLAFNVVNGTPYLYVVDYEGGTSNSGLVTIFNASTGLNLTAYNTDTAGDLLNGPIGIAFNAAGDKAYISNAGNNTLIVCDVISTGMLDACYSTTEVSGLLDTPGIPLVYTSFFNQIIIPNNNSDTLTHCFVSGLDGSLSNCINLTDATLNAPNSAVFIP